MTAYRIQQSGMIVARTEGEHALREIMHCAAVYSQDGPLSIQKRIKRHWKPFGVVKPVRAALQNKAAT